MKAKAKPSRSDQAILKERAVALAQERTQVRDDESVLEVVAFSLAHERYAVESKYVREVHPLNDITPLPGTLPFVAGIVSVRGRVLAVIDIKKFFDLPEEGITDVHKIILIQSGDHELGLLADTVIGLSTIPLDKVQASLPNLQGIREEYLRGVTDERLVILNATQILMDKRLSSSSEPDQ